MLVAVAAVTVTVLVATVDVTVRLVDAVTVFVAAVRGNLVEQYDCAGGKPARFEATTLYTPVHGSAAETKEIMRSVQRQDSKWCRAILVFRAEIQIHFDSGGLLNLNLEKRRAII